MHCPPLVYRHLQHVQVGSCAALQPISMELRLTSLLGKPAAGPRLPVFMLVRVAAPKGTPLLLKEILLRCCTKARSPTAVVRGGGGGTVTTPRLGTATPRLMSREAMR